MSLLLLGAAVLVTVVIVALVHRPHEHPSRRPVVAPGDEQEWRTRYLTGQIGIGVYLDHRYGTSFDSAGEHHQAG